MAFSIEKENNKVRKRREEKKKSECECLLSEQVASSALLGLLLELHSSLGGRSSSTGGRGSFLDLGRHRDERLLNVRRVLGAGLQARNPQTVGEFFGRVAVHHFLRGQIAFVAHQQLVHALAGVAIDLLKPLLHVVERHLIRHVVHHDDTVCSPIVARGDRSESFLPSSIPDLELDFLSFKLDGSDFEIDSNCADVAFCVSVVCESKEKAGFSDTAVSNQQKFEKMIIVG